MPGAAHFCPPLRIEPRRPHHHGEHIEALAGAFPSSRLKPLPILQSRCECSGRRYRAEVRSTSSDTGQLKWRGEVALTPVSRSTRSRETALVSPCSPALVRPGLRAHQSLSRSRRGSAWRRVRRALPIGPARDWHSRDLPPHRGEGARDRQMPHCHIRPQVSYPSWHDASRDSSEVRSAVADFICKDWSVPPSLRTDRV